MLPSKVITRCSSPPESRSVALLHFAQTTVSACTATALLEHRPAKERANARIRERREAELKKERAIFKALEEYKHRKKISDEEYKLRIDFIKQYGTKEWDKLIQIKTEIEKIEKADKEYFDAELSKVRSVQFWCFFAATWIAYYIVWGVKK
jgi:hypothetical protein